MIGWNFHAQLGRKIVQVKIGHENHVRLLCCVFFVNETIACHAFSVCKGNTFNWQTWNNATDLNNTFCFHIFKRVLMVWEEMPKLKNVFFSNFRPYHWNMWIWFANELLWNRMRSTYVEMQTHVEHFRIDSCSDIVLTSWFGDVSHFDAHLLPVLCHGGSLNFAVMWTVYLCCLIARIMDVHYWFRFAWQNQVKHAIFWNVLWTTRGF